MLQLLFIARRTWRKFALPLQFLLNSRVLLLQSLHRTSNSIARFRITKPASSFFAPSKAGWLPNESGSFARSSRGGRRCAANNNTSSDSRNAVSLVPFITGRRPSSASSSLAPPTRRRLRKKDRHAGNARTHSLMLTDSRILAFRSRAKTMADDREKSRMHSSPAATCSFLFCRFFFFAECLMS